VWCRARHPLEAGDCLTEANKYFDATIERALLGTLLRGGDFGEVAYLSTDDFGTESHRQIWVSIVRVVPEVRLDFDAVTHDLIERGKLDSIGGLAALVDLHADGIPGVGLPVSLKRCATKPNSAARSGLRKNSRVTSICTD
jgi:hypothetical protein